MNDQPALRSLRPVGGAARCAVAALVLAGAAWAAVALCQLRLALSGMPASGLPDQGGGRHRTLTSLENAFHVVSALASATTVLCAFTFLAWLWRVRDNARVLFGQPPRYAGPWVYAGWIVPVANLWVPRGIIVDIHRASAPGQRLPGAVNWWWGLWLAGMLSGTSLMYTGSADDVIAHAYQDVRPLLAADAAVIGAAVSGIFVVRALTAAQRQRTGSGPRFETGGTAAGWATRHPELRG
ncbi:DUF4328 domain-containing protein [Streptomyces lydicus]|uniref:DUF4328 domain-containing protein n=1 Tax=Streptomyces lydicus TaxID=47763 RepID=UPI00101305BE|nr:DUF4328 domain-containing protein [Streptomyces lydicus]MCZ1007414.1 DUF4328 domain-containing protein [Streptomyces lydicus]